MSSGETDRDLRDRQSRGHQTDQEERGREEGTEAGREDPSEVRGRKGRDGRGRPRSGSRGGVPNVSPRGGVKRHEIVEDSKGTGNSSSGPPVSALPRLDRGLGSRRLRL